MDLILRAWKDADGIHVEDRSGIGMVFKSRADAIEFLKRTDGEDWEHSFREAIRTIAARYSQLDQPLNNQAFTFTAARATTTWQ